MTPNDVRIVRGTADDLDEAMLWLRAVLSVLPSGRREAELRRAPAMSVLLAYRHAVKTAPEA